MKTVYSNTGMMTFVSYDEFELLLKFDNCAMASSDMSEQDRETAHQLVGRGVLRRKRNENSNVFHLHKNWRPY
jgi:hypothetical protein